MGISKWKMESEKLIMGSDEDKSEKWEVVSGKLKVEYDLRRKGT